MARSRVPFENQRYLNNNTPTHTVSSVRRERSHTGRDTTTSEAYSTYRRQPAVSVSVPRRRPTNTRTVHTYNNIYIGVENRATWVRITTIRLTVQSIYIVFRGATRDDKITSATRVAVIVVYYLFGVAGAVIREAPRAPFPPGPPLLRRLSSTPPSYFGGRLECPGARRVTCRVRTVRAHVIVVMCDKEKNRLNNCTFRFSHLRDTM